MILNEKDAKHVAKRLMTYFGKHDRIDDYFRARKVERLDNLPAGLPGMGPEDDFFQSYEMPPKDMDFKLIQMNDAAFNPLVEITASFSPDTAPGKKVNLILKETTTDKIVGFMKFGSPTLHSKARNNWLGEKLNRADPNLLTRFNQRVIMGFIIVPVQPFGYNYLGGKLLAGLCCSHRIREMLNEKYNIELCAFETSSLYGSIKGCSMYDGMRPLLRYRGDSESKFFMKFGDEFYNSLKEWFEQRNGGEPLVTKRTSDTNKLGIATGYKMSYQQKILGVISASLKHHDMSAYNQFKEFIKSTEELTTKKRIYISDYGYENAREILLGSDEPLRKGENYKKFEWETIIEWWRNKANKRYESLRQQKKVRHDLEVWNASTIDTIDIIR